MELNVGTLPYVPELRASSIEHIDKMFYRT